jgi:hypothetical protein
MGKVSGEAGRPANGATRRPGAKAQGGGRGPTARQQFHLGAETVKRLGVHAALVGKDRSRVVEQVLSSWLRREGKGRELFGAVNPDDRSREATEINPDEEETDA